MLRNYFQVIWNETFSVSILLLEAGVNENGGHLGFDPIISVLGGASDRRSYCLSHSWPTWPLTPSSSVLLFLVGDSQRQPEQWPQRHMALGLNLSSHP